MSHWGFSQQGYLKFSNLSIEDGLSQATVNSIFQDSRGFLWVGTEDGLNRFDGYNFKIYTHKDNEPNTISNNRINDIIEDENGNLWIGTTNGLNFYNRATDTFKAFRDSSRFNNFTKLHIEKNHILLASENGGLKKLDFATSSITKLKIPELEGGSVWTIAKAENNHYWIGTIGKGLVILNEELHYLKKYTKDDKENFLSGNVVRTITKDSKGDFWVGTEDGGLNFIQPDHHEIKYFNTQNSNLKSNAIWSVIQDKTGNIWIGTDGGGLNFFNYKTGTIHPQMHIPGKITSISSNVVRALLQDKKGDIWAGTFAGGLNYFNQSSNVFVHFNHQADNPNSLAKNSILSFAETQDGKVWVGTDGGGLDLFDGENFTHFKNIPGNKNSISDDVALCLETDDNGGLWIGTYTGGLNHYKNGKFTSFLNNAKNANTLSNNSVWAICNDTEGGLWVGTNGGGVNFFDPETKIFKHYRHNPEYGNSLADDAIRAIIETRNGKIAIGTFGGLSILDKKTGNFTNFQHNPKDPKSLSHNIILTLFEDSKGRIWIGTYGAGLNLYNEKTGDFLRFTEEQGLPNNVVYGILEDEAGNLWISTNKGIARFNLEDNVINHYNTGNGLQSDAFNLGAAMKTKAGKMYFGGINGFNIFNPEDVKNNTFIPPVAITDFQIFNNSVPIEKENGILSKVVGETEAITISYKESVFSFEFTGLNFANAKNNQYAYKLEGFDKDWNEVGNRRFATYTNLPAGKTYTFRVKASNNDGVWNEKGVALDITITPPWWETWWFKISAVLLVVGGAFAFYKIRMKAVKKQNQRLEKMVEEQTSELRKQKEDISQVNEELQSSEEELRQNMEELQAIHEALEYQRNEIEREHNKTKKSIKYAERIQKAILPDQSLFQEIFPESFLIFKPKDIVSGDFYWCIEEDDFKMAAVIDCTGHGVPGAFMSMIGNNLLNEAVTKHAITSPAEILQYLHNGIRDRLSQDSGKNADGMDLGLCKIEYMKNGEAKLTYAGAKHKLYIMSDDKMIELKGCRKSIGGKYAKNDLVFENHETRLKQGDIVYLTTDGFIDQASPERLSFSTSKLKTLISDNFIHDMEDQKEMFEWALEDHQKTADQRDDITLMGLKI